MSDQQAIPPNSTNQQFGEGTSVYDVNGEQVGTVGKHDLVGNVLILYKGTSFHRDIQVPLSTVQRSDARGIYLSISKDELQQEGYTAPPTTAVTGADGLILQGVDVIEQSPDTVTQGVSVIEQSPNTITQGVSVVEQSPDTYTQGEDTIEPHAAGPMSDEV
jgi:hypothetical protein